MRTIIDISNEQVKALDELSRLEETSRVALIRLAIDQFLARQTHEERARELAFGIWKD
ncbi:MAG: CopG family transcriptional regulator, partial [Pseudomonadota bacterium]